MFAEICLVVFLLSTLVGVFSSIPSLLWIRKMRDLVKNLGDVYKKEYSYKLNETNETTDLSEIGKLSTPLSGTYLTAIIWIGILAIVTIIFIVFFIKEDFNSKSAADRMYRWLDLKDIEDPDTKTVFFVIVVMIFIGSFFFYVGFFVALSNSIKTILSDPKMKKFVSYLKDNKLIIPKEESERIIEIMELMQKTLDSSSTAITSFGIAGIAFVGLIVAGSQ